jgi:6-phosphogluconate dehydrogenase (decarboxylating)
MELGMVGLGRMGSGMTRRIEEHGHEVKTYDPQVPSTAKTLGELKRPARSPRRPFSSC